MLIMNYKDYNGNDLSGFIVLSQIGFNWIMDMMMGTTVEVNANTVFHLKKKSS